MATTIEYIGAYQIIVTLFEELRWPLKVLTNIAQRLAETGDHSAINDCNWLTDYISLVDDPKEFLSENVDDDLAAVREVEDLEDTLDAIAFMADILYNHIPSFTNVAKAKRKEYREDIRDIVNLINEHRKCLRETFSFVFPDNSEEDSPYSL